MNKESKNIEEWVNSSIKQNDRFYSKKNPGRQFFALGIDGTRIIANYEENKDARIVFDTQDSDLFKQAKDFKGVNPFYDQPIRFVDYDLDNILTLLGYDRKMRKTRGDQDMPYVNFNPYFIIDGKQEYYQRGYIWSIKQKQALISSMYRGLEAGRIIVHVHSYQEQEKMIAAGYKDFASRDIVDGKQRLSTVISFIQDEFADEQGNYFSELSDWAKRRFGNYKGFSYGEMTEYCSPKQIAEVFLNNATAGTPISQEHIDYMLKIKQFL